MRVREYHGSVGIELTVDELWTVYCGLHAISLHPNFTNNMRELSLDKLTPIVEQIRETLVRVA